MQFSGFQMWSKSIQWLPNVEANAIQWLPNVELNHAVAARDLDEKSTLEDPSKVDYSEYRCKCRESWIPFDVGRRPSSATQ